MNLPPSIIEGETIKRLHNENAELRNRVEELDEMLKAASSDIRDRDKTITKQSRELEAAGKVIFAARDFVQNSDFYSWKIEDALDSYDAIVKENQK